MVFPPDAAVHDAWPPSADALAAPRARLDAIDAVLLRAVRDRVRVCVEIADIKRREGVPMMQPQRIAHVHERAARYAARHGLDGEFLHRLYDLIVEETCRVEDRVIAEAAA
jgi:4-amino-4-deoxychorismate mutase